MGNCATTCKGGQASESGLCNGTKKLYIFDENHTELLIASDIDNPNKTVDVIH